MCIVDRIRQLSNAKGMSITVLEETLGFGNGTIGKWKKQSPSCNKANMVADFLQTSIDYLITGKEKSSPTELTADEQELLKYYKKLNDIQKGIIIGRAETLAGVDLQECSELEQKPKTIYIDMFSLPVSAGAGIYLDGSDKEMIEVESNKLTQQANFALTVVGDSMEPKYCDGDVVLIESQPAVNVGEIGIFIYENEGYIKKFGGNKLISLNPKYQDILIKDCDSFYCKGKVIGKL